MTLNSSTNPGILGGGIVWVKWVIGTAIFDTIDERNIFISTIIYYNNLYPWCMLVAIYIHHNINIIIIYIYTLLFVSLLEKNCCHPKNCPNNPKKKRHISGSICHLHRHQQTRRQQKPANLAGAILKRNKNGSVREALVGIAKNWQKDACQKPKGSDQFWSTFLRPKTRPNFPKR